MNNIYSNLTFLAKSVKLITIYISKNTHNILNTNFINSINIRPNGNLILPIVTLYLSNSFKSGIPSWSKSIENSIKAKSNTSKSHNNNVLDMIKSLMAEYVREVANKSGWMKRVVSGEIKDAESRKKAKKY